MFLYEILSGARPFRDFKSAVEIKKAIRRNVRPTLEDSEVDTQLPRLERIMVQSWHELPERRPSSEEILRKVQEPEVLCHCRVMPNPESGAVLEKVTSVFGIAHGTSKHIHKMLNTKENSMGCSVN